MQRKVLVTGGAGFIGSAVCRRLVADGASVLNLDALTYAGNLQSLAKIDNAPNYRFAKVDICDRPRGRRGVRDLCSGPCHPSGRREPRRSLDHGGRRVHPDQHRWRLLDAGGGASLLADLAGAATGRVSLSACVDRRSLRLARGRGRVRRGDALRSEFAVFRLQGGRRSSGLGLGENLWLPGRNLELLEQLRPLSFPREAHSAHHPQRPAWQAPAGLWRRRQCARLALCRRPRAGARFDCGERQDRRKIQCRRPQRTPQH